MRAGASLERKHSSSAAFLWRHVGARDHRRDRLVDKIHPENIFLILLSNKIECGCNNDILSISSNY